MTRTALVMLVFVSACASGAPAPIDFGRAGAAPPPDAYDRPQRPTSPPPQPADPRAAPRLHRVGEDERLYDIAARFQIPMATLIAENDLVPPYALRPGQNLRLPAPLSHRVAASETFESIADRYAMDRRSLALYNRMQPPYVVREGDVIALPALPGLSSAPMPTASMSVDPAPIATPVGSGRFSWPVVGDVITRFGAQANGGRIDGIEIAGADGDPIRAASDGEVVYAGADLPAYGQLVLIRHDDGYVTAYGYARDARVREGQRVRAGEEIASIDALGRSPARVLFQVRQGREAIDPAPLLGAR